MPHVRALFIEDRDVIALLASRKTHIRKIISRTIGYDSTQVALFPEMIPQELASLCDNVLPLEFVIDSGEKSAGHAEAMAELILDELITEIRDLANINFGIWLRVMSDNGFSEYKVRRE